MRSWQVGPAAVPVAALAAGLAVVLLATGLLGWWQLEAWRTARSGDVADRLDRAPVALGQVLGPDEPLANEDVGVPVLVEGRYAPAPRQFLVTGREQQGVSGYWVLAPLLVDGTGSSMLVVRGWTADGEQLPPVPAGHVRQTGVLQPGEDGSGAVSAGRVVQSVRIPALVGTLRTDVYGGFLLATDPDPVATRAGLEPVQAPEPDPSWSVGLRNLTYALQWWLFGAFAAFWWWRLRADQDEPAQVGRRSVAG